jgi:UDP-GlcNAc:undecaprenyl-phosphate/decaprenyl-phosphate GlcNAc-1-phosphate transferase
MSMPRSTVVFALAFGASLALTATTVLLGRRLGWVVQPREDRWSKRPVVKFGGIAILLAFLIVGDGPLSHYRDIVGLTVAMGLLGLLDDLFGLRPLYKLLAQAALAGLAVAIGVMYMPFPQHGVNVAFTVFWLVAITNAFNLLDNMDGLAAGVALISCVNLAFLVNSPSDPLALLVLAMGGALLGFLIFNFNPARIFMGDTGSLMIGFFLACTAVLSAQRITSTASVIAVPAMVLFLPIFDMALVSVTRRLNGRAISAGAKDHSSHRLVLLGISERQAVLLLYAIAAGGGAIAYGWRTYLPQMGPGVLILFLLFAVFFWLYLARVELPEDWLSRTNVFTLVVPQLVNSVVRSAAMVAADATLLLLSLYFGYLVRYEGLSRFYVGQFLFVGALALAIKLPLLMLYSAYRRDWQIHKLRDVYPIAKASVAGFLILLAVLAYLVRLQEISRTVLAVTALFDAVFLTVARVMHRIFDDALVRRSEEEYVLVGGPSAHFFAHYFEWKQPGSRIVAVLATDVVEVGNQTVMGSPMLPFTELENVLKRHAVTGVHLLPDCPEAVREFTRELCRSKNVALSVFHFSLESLADDPRGISRR